MQGIAISKSNRISIRKLCRVAKTMKNKAYDKVISQLQFLPQKASKILLKTIKSAGANLKAKGIQSPEASWKINEIVINRGSYYKRFEARARGRANILRLPLSHVRVSVSESNNKKRLT